MADLNFVNPEKSNNLMTYNTSSLIDSLQFMTSPEFKSSIRNTDTVYKITFKISAGIGTKLNETSIAHNFDFRHSVLISFKSLNDKGESKIFWKLSGCNDFYFLELMQPCSELVIEFCERFLVEEIGNGKCGILQSSIAKESIEIHDIGNENHQNLLILAALENNVELVDELLKIGLNIEHEDEDKHWAIEKAWILYLDPKDDETKEKSNQIILKLLEANSPLPFKNIGFEYEKASKEVQKFIDKCDNIHKDVENGSFESLKEQLKLNPNLRHFYNRDGCSLISNPSISKNAEKLKQLFSLGISSGYYEDIDEIYRHIESEDKHMIRNQHVDSAKQNPKAHLLILNQKAKIGGNDLDYDKRGKNIKEAFKILNENEFCAKILKVVAAWNNLQIIFDFKQDSIYYLDPASSEFVRGAAYNSGKVFIGAKNLLLAKEKFRVFGVIIHELCHFAVLITFMNDFNPFPMYESEAKKRFETIVAVECERNKELEPMVSNVYKSYQKSHQYSELIVLVVQMIMFYYEMPEKLAELQEVYAELFKYFNDIIVPELEMAVEVLKNLQNVEMDVKFDNLTEPMKAKILHSKIKFQNEETTLFEIIESDHDILNYLSSKSIRSILLDDKTIDIGKSCSQTVKYKFINRKFTNQKSLSNLLSSSSWRNNQNLQSEFKQIKELTEMTKIFILSDMAGSGKTTAFIDLAKKLKKNYKNFWVLYIKLQLHQDIFKRYQNSKLNIRKVLRILLKVLKSNSSDEIEVNLFTKLFNENKTILLLDGIDEICPAYNTFIIQFIDVLRQNTKNQLWISTRPQHATQLEEIFKTSIFKFEPYTDDNINEFIAEILKSLLSKKENKQKEAHLSLRKFLREVSKNSSSSHYNVNNPLMIEIITELHVNGVINLKLDNINLYKLISQIVDKQKEIIDKKIQFEDRKLYMDFSINKVHQVIAIKCIFNEHPLLVKLNKLSIVKSFEKEKKWTDESIQRYGFITVDSNNINSFNFTHRTYAEFFVVQMIKSYLFEDTSNSSDIELQIVFKLFMDIVDERFYYGFIFTLLHSYVKDAAVDFSITLPPKVIEYFMMELPNIREKMFYILESNEISNSNVYKMSLIKYLELLMCILRGKIERTKRDLWQVAKHENLLKKILCSTVLNNFESLDLLLEILENSFGPKWPDVFNKNVENILTNEDIIAGTDELLSNFTINLLKLLDLIKKNFKPKPTKTINSNLLYNCMILDHVEQIIQTKIFYDTIEVFRNSTEGFVAFLRASLEKTSFNVFKYIGDKIEQLLKNDRSEIRNVLFYQHYKNNPLLTALCSNRNDIFQRYKELYVKYCKSEDELQTIFLNHCDLCHLFYAMDAEIYPAFKEFIIYVFASKKELIFNFSNYHELELTKITKAFSFFEDFAVAYFDNDLRNIKSLACKIFYFTFSNRSHPLIESAMNENLNEFFVCKELFLKYLKSKEELRVDFIRYCYLPKVILCIRPQIYPEFKKLVKEIFNSNKELIIKCFNDQVPIRSNTGKNVYGENVSISIYDEQTNKIKTVKRSIMYNSKNYFGKKFWIKTELMLSFTKIKLFEKLILELFQNDLNQGWKVISNALFHTHSIWDYIFLKGINTNYWIKIETITTDKLQLFEEISLCYCAGNAKEARNFVRKILFYDNNPDYHSFHRVIKMGNLENFKRFKKFYIKYKNSWEELQNIFISFCDLHRIFAEVTDEIYLEFEDLLLDTFVTNKDKIFECFDRNCWMYYYPEKTMKMFKNFENFASVLFINDRVKCKGLMRQIVFHKYWINHHPLIESILAKTVDEFLFYKDLCMKYMNTKEEIHEYLIKWNYISHVLLKAEPEIYSEFMLFIKEIFDSDIQKINEFSANFICRNSNSVNIEENSLFVQGLQSYNFD